MGAAVREIDFSLVDDQRDPMPIPATFGKHGALVMNRKQMRQRVRRSKSMGKKRGRSADFDKLYKPVSEWDHEELARGRPRDKNGEFRGLAPRWVTREVHEEAMTRFRQVIRDDMNSLTPSAIGVIQQILDDNEYDEKGKPVTPASVKLSAATMLVEQVLGKPKQKVETDISVRMQGMLASVVVTPETLPAFPNAKELTSPRDVGVIDVEGYEDEDD